MEALRELRLSYNALKGELHAAKRKLLATALADEFTWSIPEVNCPAQVQRQPMHLLCRITAIQLGKAEKSECAWPGHESADRCARNICPEQIMQACCEAQAGDSYCAHL